jgi:integrase
MGSVFKPKVTRPLPGSARVTERDGVVWATWSDRRGKKRQARVSGAAANRIVVESGVYQAKFVDGDGVVRVVSTGCRSFDTARAKLVELESVAEKVRAGVLTKGECDAATHSTSAVESHVMDYLDSLRHRPGRGAKSSVSASHVANVKRSLEVAIEECGFRKLRDLQKAAVESWVRRLRDQPRIARKGADGKNLPSQGWSPRTINAHLAALTAWGNWLVAEGRLLANPFSRFRKLSEQDDTRRRRRALTADELHRLLVVARWRPLAEHGRESLRVVDERRASKSRATWKKAGLQFEGIVAAAERGRQVLAPEVAERLDRDGRGRALLYSVLVTTGLRKNELATLTVGDVELDPERPVVRLRGANAKSGQPATIPLRPDIARLLRGWLEERNALAAGKLSRTAELIDVPTGLIRILDRDLAVAGISKVDDRGRTVDVHAFRHTFATHLVAAGVAPRTAQAALRHSSLDLTTQLYTDPRLLDVAGALESLPALPSVGSVGRVALADRATRSVAPDVAPDVALTPVHGAHSSAQACSEREAGLLWLLPAKPLKRRSSAVSPQKTEERAKGLEPSTSSLGS